MKKLLIIFSLALAALAFVSCGSDKDGEPNYPNKTMIAGETYTIPGKKATWTSDNPLIASVTGSTVTANRVGETTIRNGSNSFRVTVNGKYNTYREPCLQWGATKSTVKGFMSGYVLDSEKNDFLVYYGKSPVSLIAYTLKNSGLVLSSLVISIGAVSMDELVAFMAERYIYVTQDEANNYFGFITADKKSIVYLQIETINSQLVYFISYAAASSSNSAPASHLKRLNKLSPSQHENRVERNLVMSRLNEAMPKLSPEQDNIGR
ncbi:MAG: Ig-like domain-containing protein [Muribaculaceae bacterium]|nr:Ig-like domain-containing protein [Muribaculaceae bacterium]